MSLIKSKEVVVYAIYRLKCCEMSTHIQCPRPRGTFIFTFINGCEVASPASATTKR